MHGLLEQVVWWRPFGLFLSSALFPIGEQIPSQRIGHLIPHVFVGFNSVASAGEQGHEEQHQGQEAELGERVGLFTDEGGTEVLDGRAVRRQDSKGDHLGPGTLRVFVPRHDLDRLKAVSLEGVGDRLSDEVGVVVRDAVFVAVVVDINVPRHGQVAHIVERIERTAGIEQASLVGHAGKRCCAHDWRRVEHQDLEDFTGVGSVIIGDVIDEFVGATAVPRNGQVVADDIAIVVGAADIIGIHARVDVPATYQGVNIRWRVGR